MKLSNFGSRLWENNPFRAERAENLIRTATDQARGFFSFMKVLGIESSCDETAAAVVGDGREILSSVVASQVDLHKNTAGWCRN